MSFVKFSNRNYVDTPLGQSSHQERNAVAQLSNQDYISPLNDRETCEDTYEAISETVTVNIPERTEGTTMRGRVPSWVYHPCKIIAIAVVGVFLLSMLSNVISIAVTHYVILTNGNKSQTSPDQNFIHFTDVNRRLNKSVYVLHRMQENHSDTLDHLTDIDAQTNDVIHKMQEKQDDALGHLKGIDEQLVDIVYILNKMQEKLNNFSAILESCKVCPGGWTRFGNLCYQVGNGKINFRKAVIPECRNGWVQNGSSCYLFGGVPLNFTKAVDYCADRNAYLVEIETAEENDFLQDYIMLNNDDHKRYYYWLGMTDNGTEGVWKWYHSGNTVQFTDWGKGEPNNSGRKDEAEDCALTGSAWNDIACNENWIKPLCEIRSCM